MLRTVGVQRRSAGDAVVAGFPLLGGIAVGVGILGVQKKLFRFVGVVVGFLWVPRMQVGFVVGNWTVVPAMGAAAWALASVGLMGHGAAVVRVLLAGGQQMSLGAEHCARAGSMVEALVQ